MFCFIPHNIPCDILYLNPQAELCRYSIIILIQVIRYSIAYLYIYIIFCLICSQSLSLFLQLQQWKKKDLFYAILADFPPHIAPSCFIPYSSPCDILYRIPHTQLCWYSFIIAIQV